MKTTTALLSFASLTALLLSGCSSTKNSMGYTNQNQPGPAAGRTVGAGAGAVAGNVAGFGVGAVEGASGAARSAFDNTQRVVRYWHQEKTPDGRIIMVPEEYLVDADGRIIRKM